MNLNLIGLTGRIINLAAVEHHAPVFNEDDEADDTPVALLLEFAGGTLDLELTGDDADAVLDRLTLLEEIGLYPDLLRAHMTAQLSPGRLSLGNGEGLNMHALARIDAPSTVDREITWHTTLGSTYTFDGDDSAEILAAISRILELNIAAIDQYTPQTADAPAAPDEEVAA